jgi:hypothetical protein
MATTFLSLMRRDALGVLMETVLYLASLAARPSIAATRRIWTVLQHFLAGLMVLFSFLLLLHAFCGA